MPYQFVREPLRAEEADQLCQVCETMLEKLSIWGMAQLSDEFHDGHRRTRDSRLEVIGSWMKKSTVLN